MPRMTKAAIEGERRWKDAIDWLLNSRHTADPDIQDAFWGMVDGDLTRDQADGGDLYEYRAKKADEEGDPARAASLRAILNDS